MSKKQLNEAAIMSELRGESAFFRKPDPPPADPQPTRAPVHPSQSLQNEAISAPVAPPERLEHHSPTSSAPSSLAQSSNQPPTHVASEAAMVEDLPPSTSVLASNQASTLASYHASIIDAIRKTVKKGGKEVTFVRLTPEEKNQLTDLVFTYKRQDIKTSENEISRIAINFLLEDYKIHGDASILAQVIASLLA
jgi:hypothetical protein